MGLLLRHQQSALRQLDRSVEAFNVGVNVGIAAGQTVMHCHFHLAPWRTDDVDDSRGGIRHIIHGKGAY